MDWRKNKGFPVLFYGFVAMNEAPRSKLRGIKAELRRSQPAFALKIFGAVRHAILSGRGPKAKANKK